MRCVRRCNVQIQTLLQWRLQNVVERLSDVTYVFEWMSTLYIAHCADNTRGSYVA